MVSEEICIKRYQWVFSFIQAMTLTQIKKKIYIIIVIMSNAYTYNVMSADLFFFV